MPSRARFAPAEAEYTKAILQLTEGANNLLGNWPEWQKKLVSFMIVEMGAPEVYIWGNEAAHQAAAAGGQGGQSSEGDAKCSSSDGMSGLQVPTVDSSPQPSKP